MVREPDGMNDALRNATEMIAINNNCTVSRGRCEPITQGLIT